MRQIVLDIETTGLEIGKAHRIIEIGCIELVNRKISGNRWHSFINPQREIDQEANLVHKITRDFLADKPLFSDLSEKLLNFLADAELIAHNAPFDIGFLNYEIGLTTHTAYSLDKHHNIIDTLELARKKFPGQRNSLDALCKRYKIDLQERKNKGHGALLDAELLARVYLLLTEGQDSLFNWLELDAPLVSTRERHSINNANNSFTRTATRVIRASEEELAAHNKLLALLAQRSKSSLWKN